MQKPSPKYGPKPAPSTIESQNQLEDRLSDDMGAPDIDDLPPGIGAGARVFARFSDPPSRWFLRNPRVAIGER